MAEWSIATVLKTVMAKVILGSNPSLSASLTTYIRKGTQVAEEAGLLNL